MPAKILNPNLGLGLGLRPPHYRYILDHLPSVAWFEAISENFIATAGGDGGRPLHLLEKVRSHYPIVLHGVSLSIGAVDPLDREYLHKLKTLYRRIEPSWVSDHLCWTGAHGQNLHDLLPLPYTEEALRHVVDRVSEVQDFLGRRLLLENVSSYVSFTHSEMTEWEFLSAISERADCGILLDINNIYVSSVNHGYDPVKFLEGIPIDRVGQFHLAGHSDNGDHLVDTHDHPVAEPVWDLYRKAQARFGGISTLLERDDHIPDFEELFAELRKANFPEKDDDEPIPVPRPAPAMDALDSLRS